MLDRMRIAIEEDVQVLTFPLVRNSSFFGNVADRQLTVSSTTIT